MKPLKIIYIHPHVTPYDYYANVDRVPVCWQTPDGRSIRIWGDDWGDLLGESLLAHTPLQHFEVWQPEGGIDKVYSHQFDSGLCHKLFPASIQRKLGRDLIVSPEMITHLIRERQKYNVVVHTEVSAQLGWMVCPARDVKLIGTFHGVINLPHLHIFKLRRNVMRYFGLIRDYFELQKLLPHYDLITYQNEIHVGALKKLFPGPLKKITMGVDFDRFTPMDKMKCRSDLDFPLDKKIIVSVGRLNTLKQNDQLIRLCVKLGEQFDFLLVIVGSPDEQQFMRDMEQLAAPLAAKGKIRFAGYKWGEELVKYYNSADLFIMTSQSEGGPVTSMEAIACGIPVLSTDTGYVAGLLAEQNRGYIVGAGDYTAWEDALSRFLKGELAISPLERKVAAGEFSWKAVAEKFYSAYTQI